MPVAEATVRTPRASRFLVQLCRHAEAMGARKLHRGRERPEVVRVEWTEEAGLIEFTWGRCTLRSTAEELAVELDIDGDDRLRVIRDLLTADLERFGQREGLKVGWQGVEAAAGKARKRGTKIALVAAVVLAVVAHVAVGGAAVTSWRWASVAADVLLAVVVLKIVVVAVFARRLR